MGKRYKYFRPSWILWDISIEGLSNSNIGLQYIDWYSLYRSIAARSSIHCSGFQQAQFAVGNYSHRSFDTPKGKIRNRSIPMLDFIV